MYKATNFQHWILFRVESVNTFHPYLQLSFTFGSRKRRQENTSKCLAARQPSKRVSNTYN